WQLAPLTPSRSQTESSKAQQAPAREPSTSTVSAPNDMGALFRQRCVKCHGKEGTGRPARDRLPEIPDFTKPSWQKRRSDAQLMASILDGKGTDMPPERGEVSEEQARGLVAH